MEGTTEGSASYTTLEIPHTPDDDKTVPTFRKATLPMQTVLVAYLDKDRPLSEPRWVKTGDVQDWLKSMFGRMFWVAGDAADGWEKRVEVVDPDPVSASLCTPSLQNCCTHPTITGTNHLDGARVLGRQLERRAACRATALPPDPYGRDG